jgi:hypothetical protein
MEMFKGMGAKMRFRSAVANGNQEVADEAAAEMLQGAKCGRRRCATSLPM